MCWGCLHVELPLWLQEQLEEQSPGFGSTQGTEVAGKGVGMRSRALLEQGEGNTPRVPPEVSVLTLGVLLHGALGRAGWSELTPTSHPQFQLSTQVQAASSLEIQLGGIHVKPWNAVGCEVVMPIQDLSCF